MLFRSGCVQRPARPGGKHRPERQMGRPVSAAGGGAQGSLGQVILLLAYLLEIFSLLITEELFLIWLIFILVALLNSFQRKKLVLIRLLYILLNLHSHSLDLHQKML